MEGVLHSLLMCKRSHPCNTHSKPYQYRCSSLALVAFNLENSGDIKSVSQSLNIVYHSPAQL